MTDKQPDTKWAAAWRETYRWRNGRFLKVSWSPRGYWNVKLDGEAKPTQHASREAAMRAAERRAKESIT